jgi:hypothetical protein
MADTTDDSSGASPPTPTPNPSGDQRRGGLPTSGWTRAGATNVITHRRQEWTAADQNVGSKVGPGRGGFREIDEQLGLTTKGKPTVAPPKGATRAPPSSPIRPAPLPPVEEQAEDGGSSTDFVNDTTKGSSADYANGTKTKTAKGSSTDYSTSTKSKGSSTAFSLFKGGRASYDVQR